MKNIGTIIKLKRIEQGISQEELCQGICAPSYLSRIENNRLIADDIIYKLLFERLGLEYEKYFTTILDLDERIENWYKCLLENKPHNEDINELMELATSSDENTFLKFQIVYCRQILLNNNIEEACKILNGLKKIISPELHRNFFIYTEVSMLFFLKNGEFSKAVEIGTKFLKIAGYESLANDYELGIFFYNLSLTYKGLLKYESAMHYAEIALNIFKDGFYLEDCLACYIVLGICYNNIKKWKKSIETYKLAKRLLTYLPENDNKRVLCILNNNMGNCFEYQKKYNEAINYYLKSLSYIKYIKNNNEKSQIIINIIRCYYEIRDIKSVKYWLESAKAIYPRISKKFQLQIDIYSALLSYNENINLLEVIQKDSIKYFISIKDWKLAIRYCHLFADIYESMSHYKMANKLNKCLIMCYEKMIFNGGDT